MVDRQSRSGWLLHIGAGQSSVDTLRAARRQGIRTVVIDIDPNAPGMAYATQPITRSQTDLDGIRREIKTFAEQHSLIGCLTNSSASPAAFAAASLREDYQLPGLRSDRLATLQDRSEWKARLTSQSIRTPKSISLSSLEELDEFLLQQTSVLLKPESGGCGSLGVARIRRGDPRRRDLFEEARQHSTSGLVLAETFISGEEYSIDGVVRDGVFTLLHLGRKFSMLNHRGTLPTGYAWGAPSGGVRSGDDPKWNESHALAASATNALTLDDTFLSLDVLDDGHRVFIVDLGVQLNAKVDRCLDFSGIDVAGLGCAVACGIPWNSDRDPASLRRGYAMRFFYSNEDGRLLKTEGPEPASINAPEDRWQTIQIQASRLRIEWQKEVGDSAERPRSVSDLVFCALVEGEDRNLAWMRANEIDPKDLFTIQNTLKGASSTAKEWTAKSSE